MTKKRVYKIFVNVTFASAHTSRRTRDNIFARIMTMREKTTLLERIIEILKENWITEHILEIIKLQSEKKIHTLFCF